MLNAPVPVKVAVNDKPKCAIGFVVEAGFVQQAFLANRVDMEREGIDEPHGG